MQRVDANSKISRAQLEEMSKKMLDNIVKAVVDVEKKVMLIDAPFHSDQELVLLEEGSKQENLWGINLHPLEQDEDFIVFYSMVNLRPSFGNSSRGIDDPRIKEQVRALVIELVI